MIRLVIVHMAMAGALLANQHPLEHAESSTVRVDCSQAPTHSEAMPHTGDGGHDEHRALLELVPVCAATHTAIRSGAWSEASTWDGGQLPGAGARVLIPRRVAVEGDRSLGSEALEWVRVDGRLSSRPSVDTRLTVSTLAVTDDGRLQVGSATEPIRADVTAKLWFSPRDRQDGAADPLDLGGGLISSGTVEMAGAHRTAHGRMRLPVRKGLDVLKLDDAPVGWRLGDRLLIPGISHLDDEDEERVITAISKNGRGIHLDRPLDFDHFAPAGVPIAIGNLTRNIELRSSQAEPLRARGHVMIMHAETATTIDGVALLQLGRTDTRRAPTIPEIGADGRVRAGSVANTLARYPIHFHVLSGGDVGVPPHVVRNSVVIDSPKFGIVNHGGHVVAEDNVTLRIAGAHFVAENGSEVGAFRRNMAVRSTGSGDCLISRRALLDFAHEGFGFWLQAPAVEVTGNWASGHARAGISLFQQKAPYSDRPQPNTHGQVLYVDPRKIADPPPADGEGRLEVAHLNAWFSGNTIAAADVGIELWHHKMNAEHGELSVIEGSTIWHCQTGIAAMYAKNVAVRNSRISGPGSYGVFANPITRNLIIDGGSIEGLGIGVHVPQRGRNVVRNLVVDSDHVDLQISTAALPGRQIHIDNVDLRSRHNGIAMREWVSSTMGDIAMAYSQDLIQLTDRYGRSQRLFFPLQSPDAVPFPNNGPEALRGLTSAQIEERFGIARGGELAPAGATRLARSNALTSSSTASSPAAGQDSVDPFYPALDHFKRRVESGPSGDWTLVENGSVTSPGTMVFADETPPVFIIRTSLEPLRIHPDDIPYGLLIGGMIADKVGDRVTITSIEREFTDLRVDDDGYVRVAFVIKDSAGNRSPVELAARVTEEAVERGPNLSYWLQQPYCGDCDDAGVYREAAWKVFGRESVEHEAPYFAAIPPPPDACTASGANRVELKRPFDKEGRYGYLVPRIPAFREHSDDLLSMFRSPAILCEDGVPIGVGHDLHDDIRKKGRGRFSHWTGSLYFSTSDNSDPNENGREYALVFREPPVDTPTGLLVHLDPRADRAGPAGH